MSAVVCGAETLLAMTENFNRKDKFRRRKSCSFFWGKEILGNLALILGNLVLFLFVSVFL